MGSIQGTAGIALCPALRYILRYGKYYPAAPAAAHSSRRHSALSVAARMADVARWLEEHKAANVVSLDLNGQNAFTTALVIASAGFRPSRPQPG